MRSRSRGFTLWELMVVVGLVVVLVLAAIENLLPLRADAERAAVAAAAGALASATGLEAANRALRNGSDGIASLAGGNPVQWLAMPMANYAGAVDAGGYYNVPEGQWAFDGDTGVLFYRVRYTGYFEGTQLTPPGIRYRVAVARGGGGQVNGVELRQLDAASWQTDRSEIARILGVSR